MKRDKRRTDRCAPGLRSFPLIFSSLILVLVTLGSLISDTWATSQDSSALLLFVGPDGARPYIYSDGRQTTGILADVSKEISVRIDRPIRIQLFDFREARRMVDDGEADAVMPLGMTPERKEQFDFTTPLFNIMFTVFARENETYPSDWPNIEGVRIGVFAKGTSRSLAEEWYPKATAVTVRGSEDAMRLVEQSVIDAMITTRRTGNQAIYQGNISNVVALPITLSSTPASIAIRKGNTNLATVLNKAIDELHSKGIIAHILSRWEGTRVVLFSKQDIWVASGLTAVGVSFVFLFFGFFFLRQKRVSARRLRASEESFKFIYENIQEGLWITDNKDRMIFFNEKMEEISGAIKQDVIGLSVIEDFPEETTKHFLPYYLKARQKQKPVFYEADVVTPAEANTTQAGWLIPKINNGKYDGMICTIEDITERKQLEASLKFESTHDALTGVYNRRELALRIEHEMKRATRYNHNLSTFMLDLDHFKKVNDTYGHKAGDIVLVEIASVLEKSVRETDYVARYGGEEFIVVLPETRLEKAVELAERVREQIAKHPIKVKADVELNITTSIGVASFPEHADSWEGLFEAADKAMYSAKNAGRNCCEVSNDK